MTLESKKYIADNIGKLRPKQMAEKLGCSQNYVYQFIAKYNRDPSIVNEPQRRKGGGWVPLTDEEKQYIRENVTKFPNKHFIKRFGIAGTTLYKFIKEENLRPVRQREKEVNKDGYFEHDDYYRLLAW